MRDRIEGLHSYEQHPEAPGGKVFCYDPKAEAFEILGIPVEHDYIQTIALDRKRKIVYGNCYPQGHSFAFNLKARRALVVKGRGEEGGFQGFHKACCDEEGNLWGLCADETLRMEGISEEQARMMKMLWGLPDGPPRLFKYNPEDGFIKFDYGLPLFGGRPQGMNITIDGKDGYMYVGTGQGCLYRIHKLTGEPEYLGLPNPGGRVEGLVIGRDGLIYGAGGSNYHTRFFAYDQEDRRFHDLGPIYDRDLDALCIIVHDMAMTDEGVAYAGETDNPQRSGYLWEAKLAL